MLGYVPIDINVAYSRLMKQFKQGRGNVVVSPDSTLMKEVNEDTIIPFGKTHRGRKVKECPTDYLNWLAGQKNTELHNFAIVAEKLLKETDASHKLEMDANAFLRKHGVKDNNLFIED